jgi:hypothetical protein
MKTQIHIAGSSSLLSQKKFSAPIFDRLENYHLLAKNHAFTFSYIILIAVPWNF